MQNLKTNIKIKAYDSWSDAYNSSKAGLVDGIMGLSWAKDREKYFKYSPFYYYTPTYIVTHKQSSIKKLEDLKNKKVSGFKGAITTKILNDKVENVEVLTFKETEDILESVESVSGVIKSFDAGVNTTLTSAPDFINKRTKFAVLYAAIPALMPKRIFLPRNTDITQLLEFCGKFYYLAILQQQLQLA